MIGQIIIVQFAGVAFYTESLTLDQWLWCIFFGVGTLIWGQIVTSLPTKSLPKHLCSWGKGEPEDVDEIDAAAEAQTSADGVGRRGQILWVRGLTRLQQQIRVVNAFRMGLDTRYDSHSLTSVLSIHSFQSSKFQKQHSGQPTSPLASPDIAHNSETTTNL